MIKKEKNISSKKISHIPTGVLVLENKVVFKGMGLGYQGTTTGEVCFNTSLTGYQEIISDPSYAGQIINFTFPHIGNVGTNKEDHESDKIWTKGVIFNSEITNPSNYRSLKNLDEWLTFVRRTKKITFFFVKNLRGKCTKNCFFHFLELKSHLVEKSDFNSQNRKQSKKNGRKKEIFYKIYQIL